MTKFEELMAEYDDELIVEERSIKIDGLYADGVAWIKYDLTNAEKYCTLAEELGHHYTTSGNIINQNDVDNQKQELRARRWAYEKILPAEEILRTLTYKYTATTGSATYTPTTGIIVGPSDKGFLNNKITSSFDINCNSYKKNITSNGHNTLTFKTGSNSTSRTLSINLKMTRTPSNLVIANETFSFINLSPSKYYTLTFDVDGIATMGPT